MANNEYERKRHLESFFYELMGEPASDAYYKPNPKYTEWIEGLAFNFLLDRSELTEIKSK